MPSFVNNVFCKQVYTLYILSYNRNVPGTEYLIDVNHSGGVSSNIIMIPQPTTCGGDSLLWPRWKKYYQLFLVALYACGLSFGENTLGAAWETISKDTNVSLTDMNGGSALNYLLLGFCNIFWIPAAKRLGNRFVILTTTLICMCAGIWLGEFQGTGEWIGAMILNGLGTSAYQAVIQLTTFKMFFVHERGRMLAVYLFGQQLGSILGLISGGSIADGPGWRWSQYTVAIIDGVVFLLLFFSFEETTFPRFLFPSAGTRRDRTVASTTSGTVEKDLEILNTRPSHSSLSAEMPSSLFPRRTYLQTLTLWVYQSDDTTTYWNYFKRPFFLWSFPTAVRGRLDVQIRSESIE
ncbi:hypothetical protein EAE96_006062 [Botrytis aclada]|nr:hypothetical protein EAE96_006062 [Botrytis aclada]